MEFESIFYGCLTRQTVSTAAKCRERESQNQPGLKVTETKGLAKIDHVYCVAQVLNAYKSVLSEVISMQELQIFSMFLKAFFATEFSTMSMNYPGNQRENVKSYLSQMAIIQDYVL